MIKIGIIGGAGYTAGELIRILLNHPEVEIGFVHSASNAGNRLCDVHAGLIGETDMMFCDTYDLSSVDCLFLCSGHGKSTEFWSQNQRPGNLKVVDLAQDFRDESAGYVYGLPELQRDRICSARLVANPGCFATALQLSMLPLASAGLLPERVSVTGVTGSTGAGVKPGATTHFSWRSDNLSVYKPFTHQHLAEIRRSLASLQPGWDGEIDFVPVRGDFARGIYAMTWIHTAMTEADARRLYSDYYSDAPFTVVAPGEVDLKQAVNTNKAVIGIAAVEGRLLVTCAIDNLLKGASGQAVQNMNLMAGFDETAGLRLKPSAF